MKAAVHVGQLLQPVPGGIGRYVRRLVAALPAAGVDVSTFAAGPAPDDMPDHHDLGSPRGPLRYEAWHRLRRPAVRVPGDVVHATSLAVPPPGGRPLVVTVHDLVFVHLPQYLTPRGVAFHRRGLDIARREAAAFVVPTAAIGDELARDGVDRALVHVAPHGVDAPAREPAAGVLHRLGITEPFLLFVGTLEPRKGLTELLPAFAEVRRRHPSLALAVVGPPGWGDPPDLHRPGVVGTGRLGDAELDALYRAATAFVLPSRYEGFGLPVAEAMARGCPVVTSDDASLVEVAGGVGATVPVGDVDALVEALDQVVSDADLRDRMAAAGLEQASTLTWEASAEAHAAAYRSALS